MAALVKQSTPGQNRGWIVRDGDAYLCPAGGDVGFTNELKEAGAFASYEEAKSAAQDHCDPGYDILPDTR
ncbi:hypothetical protein IPF36_16990 [Cupriavidus sp. IK-TO18]|nr:hypothetical protein [Cupriavidus sp. IK-TO18]